MTATEKQREESSNQGERGTSLKIARAMWPTVSIGLAAAAELAKIGHRLSKQCSKGCRKKNSPKVPAVKNQRGLSLYYVIL
ncbi:hypothetical protein B4916_16195 [Yersinia intermedia]|nr:hypothetical protein B4916_16195 [Yersinia intermedia]